MAEEQGYKTKHNLITLSELAYTGLQYCYEIKLIYHNFLINVNRILYENH